MWDQLLASPLGRISKRKFFTAASAFALAFFATLSLASQPAAAAPDATWKDDSIVYQGNTFNKHSNGLPQPAVPVDAEAAYTFSEATPGSRSNSYQIIYFPKNTDPKSATSARYVEATLANNIYTAKQGSDKTISLGAQNAPNAPGGDNEDDGALSGSAETSSCNLEGIGWIVCPVSKAIAGAMDYLYGIISSFFKVEPLTTNQGSLYTMWNVFRGFANLAFVIAFIIIIYGQITGGVLSNYTIKNMLPRLVIAAVLVNVSYWVCAIAIDLSNILGYSIQDVFIGLRDMSGAPNSDAAQTATPTWANVAAALLAGGGATIAGAAALITATGTPAGLAFLLLSALLPAIFAVMIAVAVLAARQALITVFVIISPLAFVAFVLPNTDDWFNRWRKTFTMLLIMFPAFSVIFGGSQLAGALIIQNANNVATLILGMVVQVVPLFVTPFLIRLSSGIMATIANMTNDSGKGVFDRTRNWANTRRDYEKSTGNRKRAERAEKLGFVDGRRPGATRTRRALSRMSPTNMAYRSDYKRREREGGKAANEAMSDALFTKTAAGRRIYDMNRDAGLEKRAGEGANSRRYNEAMQSANYVQTTPENQKNLYRRELHHKAHEAEGIGKLAEESMNTHDDRALQAHINATPHLRDMKVRADADASHAKLQSDQVSADGNLVFHEEVDSSAALRRVVKDTHHTSKQAEQFEAIVQKAAEKSWNDRVRNDNGTRDLYLKGVRFDEGAKHAEQRVSNMVENIKVKGSDAPNVTASSATLADAIKAQARDIEIEGQAQSSAKIAQQRDLAEALKGDATLRRKAAGVDEQGEVRVLAAAKKAVSDEMIKATDNFYDTMDYDLASNPARLEAAWREAAAKGDKGLTEMIAYGRKLSQNAPGLRKLKPLLEEFTAGKDPLAHDVLILKEVLGADQGFRNAGRDLEVWANNEIAPDGNLYANFAQVRNAAAPYANITASRFARMNAYSQQETLYWLQQNDTGKLNALLDGIGSHTWQDLKGSVRDDITTLRRGDPIPDPNA